MLKSVKMSSNLPKEPRLAQPDENPSSSTTSMFQEKHRRPFMDYLDRQYSVIQQEKKEAQKDREQAKKYYHDLQVAKAERKRLEQRVIAIKNQSKAKRNSAQSLSTTLPSYSSSLNERSTTRRPNDPVPTNHSSGPRMPRPTSSLSSSSGVTSFIHHPSNSFIL